MTCAACQESLPAGARFCPSCGRRVGERPGEVSWHEADRRTFGVLPGRSAVRRARVRVERVWAVCLSRLRLLWSGVAAGARRRLEASRYRGRRSALLRQRAAAIYELGDASYRRDVAAAEEARRRAEDIDQRIAAVDRELQERLRQLSVRLARSREQEGETVVEPDGTRNALLSGRQR